MHLFKSIEDALTRAGGRTLFGKPKYKFMWSGDFTYLISDGLKYTRFRVVQENCWLLLKYEPPEWWGSEEEWNANNWEPNGLLTAGPYPRQGRYRNIMRIRRVVTLTDGAKVLENCAPTLQWIEQYFPPLRDFLELSTEEKAKYLSERDKQEKEDLMKALGASREKYRGIATSKQLRAKEEAIERWLSKEENRNYADALLAQSRGETTNA